MAYKLPTLPYAKDALAPFLTAETFDYHYGKHHAAYVNKLNDAANGTAFADLELDELIKRIGEAPQLFNNACQHYNHSFYWKCMTPNDTKPSAALASAIDAAFGSFEAFKKAFLGEAAGHFGSGWAWLVQDADGSLKITSTHDADTPLAHGQTPLLTCDVWEHAYYIDYRNARPAYLDAFFARIDWDFVSSNLG